ncbi:MAG: phosphodiesterase [Lachnospiraceae bacterium]|nr:phosphodiesterase [Lachnospiraceae bacterium]
MKMFFASDVHGSAFYCEQMLEAFDREKANKLVLLGDILYHGPRNDLPEGYAPKKVAALLNARKESILCVRGNCEAEVDQMMLEFPVLADYGFLSNGNVEIYLTHGHVYNAQNPLPMAKGAVLMCGHTHIPACEEHDSFTYMNPGSVSIPKENSARGYIVLSDGRFSWRKLDGTEYMAYEVK